MKTYWFIQVELLTEKQLVAKIKEAIEKKSRLDFELQQKVQRKNTRLVDKLLKIVADDAVLTKHINQARELGFALTAGVDEGMRAGGQLRNFYDLIAFRIGIKKEELPHLISEEIIYALTGKKKIDKNEVEKRKIGYTFALISGETLIASGRDGKNIGDWIDTAINEVKTGTTEFNGQPASRGKTRGKVKIAMLPKDSYSLEEEEVLVCSMTGPDYVPAMKRACAVVTDEGGLLSHAAIMSREFGKPCIVGTKIATKVLKDGDIVEVDAENGIVKIIKKA